MKKVFFTASVLLTMGFFLAGGVWAETLKGRIVGVSCLMKKELCPTEGSDPEMDPHIALEPDFVLHLMSGEHYHLPNVDRAVKAKYVGRKVRVSGKLLPEYKSIEVDTFEIKRDEDYKTAWSKEMMRKQWEERLKEYYTDES